MLSHSKPGSARITPRQERSRVSSLFVPSNPQSARRTAHEDGTQHVIIPMTPRQLMPPQLKILYESLKRDWEDLSAKLKNIEEDLIAHENQINQCRKNASSRASREESEQTTLIDSSSLDVLLKKQQQLRDEKKVLLNSIKTHEEKTSSVAQTFTEVEKGIQTTLSEMHRLLGMEIEIPKNELVIDEIQPNQSQSAIKLFIDYALDLPKTAAPVLMWFSRNDQSQSLQFPMQLLMASVFSGVIGKIINHIATSVSEENRSDFSYYSQVIANKMMNILSPLLGLISVGVMGYQASQDETAPPALLWAALGIFALPALIHIFLGQEMTTKFGLDRYVIGMKLIELLPLSMFAFLTVSQLPSHNNLKYQLAGVVGFAIENIGRTIVHGYNLCDKKEDNNEYASPSLQ